MKLSIIIPAYNCSKSILKCVGSIVSSSEKDYEIIVINDGSTDDTQIKLDALSQQYNFIHTYQIKNSGVSAARNIGIKYAQGKYITFVDSDDYVDKNYVSKIIKSISSNRDLYLFCGQLVKKDVPQNVIYWIDCTQDDSIDKLKTNIVRGKSNTPWDKVYKKKIIDDYSIAFRENVSLGEDWIFSMDYTNRCSNFGLIEGVLYYYCFQDGSLSQQKMTLKMFENQFLLIDRLLKYGNSGIYSKHTALKLLTNSCSKLYRNGYSPDAIYSELKKNTWYGEILKAKYPDFKSKLRCILMKNKMIELIGLIFCG